MRHVCPDCGYETNIEVAVRVTPIRPFRQAEPPPEEWLSTGQIAQRQDICKRYARRLLERGLREGHPGVRKLAGRWEGTIAAVKELRPV